MKNIFILIVLLISIHYVAPPQLESQIKQQSTFSSETADALCREGKDKRDLYFGMWKREFLKRNNMVQNYFDNHVSVIKYDNECSVNGGVVFRIKYQVRYDWALIKQNDMFAVLMSSQEEAYRHLPIKRDRFFNDAELSYVLDKINYPSISPVKSIEKLAFSSYEEALKTFQQKVKGLISENVQLTFFQSGKLPRIDGYPYLTGRGVLNKEKNLCVKGYMNLVTSETMTRDTYCRTPEEW